MSDTFDRMMGGLHGIPDVMSVKPTTIREVVPLVGLTMTFIVQTFRQKDKGDTIFVEVVTAEQHVRMVLPPKAAEAVARQRDAMTRRSRSRAAKEQAQARKAAGIEPGFMKGRKKRGA